MCTSIVLISNRSIELLSHMVLVILAKNFSICLESATLYQYVSTFTQWATIKSFDKNCICVITSISIRTLVFFLIQACLKLCRQTEILKRCNCRPSTTSLDLGIADMKKYKSCLDKDCMLVTS